MPEPDEQPVGRRATDQLRIPLSMRITPQVREQLVTDAARNGRSLTQEAEFRLEQSFRTQGLLGDVLELAYGPRIAGLLLLFGDLAEEIVHSVQEDDTLKSQFNAAELWPNSPYIYGQVAGAIGESLKLLQPPG